MNVNPKPQTVAPIETTTFDVALRHIKNGGFALAEELDAILGTPPPVDASRPTEPEPTNGDDVAGSAGYVC